MRYLTFGSDRRPLYRHAARYTLALTLVALGGCTEAPEPAEAEAQASAVRISYTGCGITKKAFMGELAAAFEAKTGIVVDISGGGATKGIVNASGGTTELGGGCRHRLPGPEEAKAQQVHVAWDALVAIVQPDNPVGGLTSGELREMLTGEIVSWAAVGGDPDLTVDVAARSGKISGVGRTVRELIFDDINVDYVPDAITYPSTGPLEQAIEKSPSMIGVTGISSANKRSVKVLAIDGVTPSYENIASGLYPYARPLFIYVGSEASAPAQQFIEYARSPEGQAVIKQQGTVNLEDGAALVEPYSQKMQALGLQAQLWQL